MKKLNVMERLEEIKKKEIKKMSDEEIKFVLDNDNTLIGLERIDYTGELLRRTIQIARFGKVLD